MSHPLMVLAAAALAATKFRVGGIGVVILVAIVVIAVAVVAVLAVQHARRNRSAPPDDWESDRPGTADTEMKRQEARRRWR